MLGEELREQGYQVLEAANGDEAINLIAAKVSIDIVISDVRMPGRVDGLGVLEFVKRQCPGLPVILCSGTLIETEAVAQGADGFVPKPFKFHLLGAVIQRVLNGDKI